MLLHAMRYQECSAVSELPCTQVRRCLLLEHAFLSQLPGVIIQVGFALQDGITRAKTVLIKLTQKFRPVRLLNQQYCIVKSTTTDPSHIYVQLKYSNLNQIIRDSDQIVRLQRLCDRCNGYRGLKIAWWFLVCLIATSPVCL